MVPWASRLSKCVWRGSARSVVKAETCDAVPPMATWEEHPRGVLAKLSEEYPQYLDAGYAALEKSTTAASQRPRVLPSMSYDEQRKYKYAIALDGHGYPGSLAAKMLLGSVLVMPTSHWPLWFTPLLKDGVHMVAVKDLRST